MLPVLVFYSYRSSAASSVSTSIFLRTHNLSLANPRLIWSVQYGSRLFLVISFLQLSLWQPGDSPLSSLRLLGLNCLTMNNIIYNNSNCMLRNDTFLSSCWFRSTLLVHFTKVNVALAGRKLPPTLCVVCGDSLRRSCLGFHLSDTCSQATGPSGWLSDNMGVLGCQEGYADHGVLS